MLRWHLGWKRRHVKHLNWHCSTGARIWWTLAMELCHLCIIQTLYCKSWQFQHPWGESFSNSQIPLLQDNVKWQHCLIYKQNSCQILHSKILSIDVNIVQILAFPCSPVLVKLLILDKFKQICRDLIRLLIADHDLRYCSSSKLPRCFTARQDMIDQQFGGINLME